MGTNDQLQARQWAEGMGQARSEDPQDGPPQPPSLARYTGWGGILWPEFTSKSKEAKRPPSTAVAREGPDPVRPGPLARKSLGSHAGRVRGAHRSWRAAGSRRDLQAGPGFRT